MNHETTMGAPSTQWWISLSSAIVYGLAFATILTLIVTPSMLMLVTRGDGRRVKRAGWFRRTLRAIWPFGRTRSRGQPAE
jgi:multidrug efflux pump